MSPPKIRGLGSIQDRFTTRWKATGEVEGVGWLEAWGSTLRGRQWRWALSIGMVACCVGCTSFLMPSGPSDREIRAIIDRNTRNLLRLQAGLFEEYVSDIMGPPQRVEGYSWGTVWLYRTALTKGARATAETDFTPLVFDRRGVLLGWGSDFLATYSHRQPFLGGGLHPRVAEPHQ